VSGDDEDQGAVRGFGMTSPKITMRVDVEVEYDGRSLSDTSSIASFPSASENSWNSSASGSRLSYDERSERSGRRGRRAESYRSRGSVSDVQSISSGLTDLDLLEDRLSAGTLSYRNGDKDNDNEDGARTPSVGIRSQALSQGILSHRLLRPDRSYAEPDAHDLGPGPPSLLTSSELGSRWLREQSQLASRLPRARSARQYDSDESLSDEESLGDIALVRDARGRELSRAEHN
jgi:hypothetical protein